MREFSVQEITDMFLADGPIGAGNSNYRYREEQISLVRGICQALEDSEFLLAEAGTGIGKTYAYLIPAIFWSLLKEEKVVIATKTKALQHQIASTDIPELEKVFDWKINWAEAKGRENYLCWNKYNSVIRGRRILGPYQIKLIEAIISWVETTSSGDRQELMITENLLNEWDLVSSNRKSCLRDRCRFRDRCFYYRMLKGLDNAGVIIVNHALLLADIAVDNSILPAYKYLIIDEAHNLDREAFDKLCSRLSYTEIDEQLKKLMSIHSLPANNKAHSKKVDVNQENIKAIAESLAQLNKELFALLQTQIDTKVNQNRVEILTESNWERVPELFDIHRNWQDSIILLNEEINQFINGIDFGDDLYNEVFLMQNLIREFSDTAYRIFAEDIYANDSLQWLESDNKQINRLCSAPINIGSILNEKLYVHLNSLVMVSATLTVAESFNYMVERLGLKDFSLDDRLFTVMEKSPFPYEKNTCLISISDAGDPTRKDYQASVEDAIAAAIEIMKGRTLILFTSRQQMLNAAQKLKGRLASQSIRILVQNEDGNFNLLLQQFMNQENIILFGLETFWEGIDLRGEILECLIIVRLPFRPPGEPYTNAACQACLHRGQNPFRDFMLPDAALRFKQGIGRLIRSEDDRGIVIVIDSRIDKKWYGRIFKKSIPIQNHFETTILSLKPTIVEMRNKFSYLSLQKN